MSSFNCYTPKKIFKDNIGVEFIVEIVSEESKNQPIDISGAAQLQLAFRKPSGVEVIQTATLTTDGTDGLMSYVSQSGDLDEAGDWALQPILTGLAGFTGRTSWSKFPVLPNIGEL